MNYEKTTTTKYYVLEDNFNERYLDTWYSAKFNIRIRVLALSKIYGNTFTTFKPKYTILILFGNNKNLELMMDKLDGTEILSILNSSPAELIIQARLEKL